MPTDLELAQTRRTQVLTILTSGTWGPDVSEQGRSIGLVAYRGSLYRELDDLNELLSVLGGPYEVHDAGPGWW